MTRATLAVNSDLKTATFSDTTSNQEKFAKLVASISEQLLELSPEAQPTSAGYTMRTTLGVEMGAGTWKIMGNRLGRQLELEVKTLFA